MEIKAYKKQEQEVNGSLHRIDSPSGSCDLLPIQTHLLHELFSNQSISAQTRIIFLEHFPANWTLALVHSLKFTFLDAPLSQINLSLDGIMTLKKISSEHPGKSLVVLVDALNARDGNEAPILFKDMLYAHPQHHFIVITRLSVGSWNIPNQFHDIKVISAEDEILRQMNQYQPELRHKFFLS